ncbi:hypothetical protein DDB_G0278337 [Dictyostelium discoideum AX4]|uniref:Uncharacterized protein n=1 Tax=Dictyostelium discoideum TaxID=44689 RepID=Q54YA4_DICDI|nr:hypothetical protein DDB_G0278337 [Dictyostelium discoideum AX4]EAL68341.1 hypothetical protein DDB_G0278337 [Dictyostelium discoideum AX4]|eukprot:XP_642298.1 hypothetical protein DDB_G0278337 [Dictyostelium discoideum AX4]
MARSLRSKRRLRNVRIQVEKLTPYNKKVLDEIIEKREEHFKSQSVDAENLNIPPELRALNKLNNKEEEEEEQESMVEENKTTVDTVESDSDEDMEDGEKKVKKTPVHLSHKENKTRYAKLYIKRQKSKKNARKIKPII